MKVVDSNLRQLSQQDYLGGIWEVVSTAISLVPPTDYGFSLQGLSIYFLECEPIKVSSSREFWMIARAMLGSINAEYQRKRARKLRNS